MTPRDHAVQATTLGGALLLGLATWLVTMASAPRYSPRDMGDLDAYCVVLLGAAVALGSASGRCGVIAAAGLGFPGLALSPWTAPRGDNDGLWLLIVPTLFAFAILLPAVGATAMWARARRSKVRVPGRRPRRLLDAHARQSVGRGWGTTGG